MQFPENVKNRIVSFLKELPIEEQSEDWKAVQCAISILLFPNSFKKNVHVFLQSSYYAREEGCYISKEISIKIYPDKLSLSRKSIDWASWRDKNPQYNYRYIYPNDKYTFEDFNNVMYDLSDLFCSWYIEDSSNYEHQINRCNFKITSNIK